MTGLGYNCVQIRDEDGELANLQVQLGKFNNTTFSDKEFGVILNHLAKTHARAPVQPAIVEICLFV